MSYPEDFVQGELAQFRAHGGLCQLGHGVFWVFYTITSLEKEKILTATSNFYSKNEAFNAKNKQMLVFTHKTILDSVKKF